MKKIITLLLSLSMLTACGWHLRGSLNLPSDLDSIYIVNQSKSTVTTNEITRLLKANDIEIANSIDKASYTISLSNERQDRRSISLGSGGFTSEYELTYEVDYVITDAEGIIVAPTTTARVIRSYTYDRDDVISKNQEEDLIKEEMERQLASQILSRLRFLSIKQAAPAPASDEQ